MSAPEVIRQDREEIEQGMAACQKQFRSALKDVAGEMEWRSEVSVESLPGAIARQARAADLIITAPSLPLSVFDNSARVNVGALTLRAGRPVLMMPRNAESFAPRNILAAWKDTREARRAFTDALPLMLEAETAVVLEVADLDDLKPVQWRVEDVARWLARHGVRALPEAVTVNTNENRALAEEIASRAPDLVVAGAYGHNRMNEWVFGGVTRDVLLEAGCPVLMSH
jgi:nucleotide-binding universal stress UspA family protein